MNHVLHIAADTQMRVETRGRTYSRRKLAARKTRMDVRVLEHADLGR
jgi:hypothetical protein